MKKYVIIVAGGIGSRMNSDIPKQFIEIGGLPIILHSLQVFKKAIIEVEFIIVVNSQWRKLWESICDEYESHNSFITVDGGPTRFHSVKNGLAKIKDENSIVAIHDAVRPLVNKNVIQVCFKEAELFGNAIPVIPVQDSFRKKTGAFNEPINRDELYIVQTPQCFQTGLIKKAYLHNYDEKFTDDAIVLENNGEQIRLVSGNQENIKITNPFDLLIAETYLEKNVE
ncbi:MAG: 2-C-methyl-D-erythritol 4-phosphate cytidylyltransferase [Bacteroidota bacterium]